MQQTWLSKNFFTRGGTYDACPKRTRPQQPSRLNQFPGTDSEPHFPNRLTWLVKFFTGGGIKEACPKRTWPQQFSRQHQLPGTDGEPYLPNSLSLQNTVSRTLMF